MTSPKFQQKNGLTVYALSCGYIQVAKYTDSNGVESEVSLRHEGGNCYTVRAAQFGGPAKTEYLATESIGQARKFWADNVERLHGDRIKAAKADKRYTVAMEHCGEREALYVARFQTGRDSWIGKSNTQAGAWLLAAKHMAQLGYTAPVESVEFSQFLRGYTAALWWSSTDDVNGETVNLDGGYTVSPQAIEHCHANALEFFTANRADIDAAALAYDTSSGDGADTGYDLAGHDFALTRNGHGAGYWDGDLPEDLGNRLTAACKVVGECLPYIGDDGQVWIA